LGKDLHAMSPTAAITKPAGLSRFNRGTVDDDAED
jgi:hypothetical protein